MADALESFAQPDDLGDLRASELHASLGERLGAQAGEALFGGTRTLLRIRQFNQAQSPDEDLGSQIERIQGGEDINQVLDKPRPPVDVSIADARARVKQEGLDGSFKLPEQESIRQSVLDLMIEHAHERRQYEAAVSRGPQGFGPGALGFLTEMGAGMIDPVNIAAFSIPVLGEARYGMILGRAGESVPARAGVRAGVGAAQGAVGGAVLAPGDWWLHTQDGQDYTMADALRSVVLSAGMGAAFHAGGGAVGDLRARMRGLPLPGSPEDLRARAVGGDTHAADLVEALPEHPFEEVPGIAAAAEPAGASPATPEAVPGIEAAAPSEITHGRRAGEETVPLHPAEVLADLPPQVREDVVRAASADVINGNAVRAGELLTEAAKDDPRIAESMAKFEAWHGSPHDFEAFDLGKIDTGEGAQAYGHGLYFAEHPGVAESYVPKMPDGIAFGSAEHADWFAETGGAGGSVYKVRIIADKDHLLDWDKPLSEQSEHVRAVLKKLGVQEASDVARPSERLKTANIGQTTGADAYWQLQPTRTREGGSGDKTYPIEYRDDAEASRILREAGIPGIKYLDQGSRTAGEGTHNFVVFDDKLIEITHKNGEPVSRGEPSMLQRLNADRAAELALRGRGQRTDWKALADGKRGPDEDLADAARAAEATPEPASVDPAKAPSAAEKAAADADALLQDILPRLSEEERTAFEEALNALDRDKDAQMQIVRDAAACLVGAVI